MKTDWLGEEPPRTRPVPVSERGTHEPTGFWGRAFIPCCKRPSGVEGTPSATRIPPSLELPPAILCEPEKPSLWSWLFPAPVVETGEEEEEDLPPIPDEEPSFWVQIGIGLVCIVVLLIVGFFFVSICFDRLPDPAVRMGR